eukprot:766725-Hanusia_phi.AAC.1
MRRRSCCEGSRGARCSCSIGSCLLACRSSASSSQSCPGGRKRPSTTVRLSTEVKLGMCWTARVGADSVTLS